MTKGEEIIAIYDETGKEVGSSPKKGAIDRNLRRGVVGMVLFNSHGELYIQKRSLNKDIAPGLYEQSARGHIDAGEDPKMAMLRELREELGVHLDDIEFVTSYPFNEGISHGRSISSFDFLYVATSDSKITLDHDEVIGGRWITIKELRKKIDESPELFTPAFLYSLPIILEKRGE